MRQGRLGIEPAVRWHLVLMAELRPSEVGVRRPSSEAGGKLTLFHIDRLFQVGAGFWERPGQRREGQARAVAVMPSKGKMQRSWGVPGRRK